MPPSGLLLHLRYIGRNGLPLQAGYVTLFNDVEQFAASDV